MARSKVAGKTSDKSRPRDLTQQRIGIIEDLERSYMLSPRTSHPKSPCAKTNTTKLYIW
jgi:hypothetical protein